MANETPNALVASAVVYINPDLPIGERLTLRSSDGIARKVVEDNAGGGNFFAAFELTNPVSNDEAVVTAQNITPNGPAVLYWVTPTARVLGIPVLDALGPNLLVMLCINTQPGLKMRSSVSVERIITTVEPITGEPLP